MGVGLLPIARATGAALLVLTVNGCSGGEASSDESSDEPVTIEITFADGEVEPNGARVEVEAGQRVDLEITADEPGSIHIHSDPEQELDYEAGTETFDIQVDRPGIVEIESHDLDQVIVQLEVR